MNCPTLKYNGTLVEEEISCPLVVGMGPSWNAIHQSEFFFMRSLQGAWGLVYHEILRQLIGFLEDRKLEETEKSRKI